MTEHCTECGDPVDGQDEFENRADVMFSALDDIDDPSMEFSLIVMAASTFLSKFDAQTRKMVRRDLFKDIDADTKSIVIRQCDA